MKAYSLCPRCLQYLPLERHHMFPQRFFGNGEQNRSIILLCVDCHKDIELLLPYEEKLSKDEYIAIHQEFLSDHPLLEASDEKHAKREHREPYRNGTGRRHLPYRA